MGLYATSLSYGPPVLRDADADASLVTELQSAIEDQRSNINIVPGEGSVLGVWVFSGDTYAFRNKSGDLSLKFDSYVFLANGSISDANTHSPPRDSIAI